MKQRAFAGAGRTGDDQGVALVQFEVDVAQDGERAASSGVVFAEIADLESHATFRRGEIRGRSGGQEGERAQSIKSVFDIGAIVPEAGTKTARRQFEGLHVFKGGRLINSF